MTLARHHPTFFLEWAALCLFGLSLAMMSGCQSGDVSANAIDLQSLADAKDAAAPVASPLSGSQVIGSGATKVTMLLPVSAQGKLGERGRNMRDAATLAMNDLGKNLITLTLVDTGGQDERAKKLAVDALRSDSSIIIGPVETNAARQLASISVTQRVPIIALAENFVGAPGVYSITLSEAGSAAEGVAFAARTGAKKFVLLVPEGAEASAIEKSVTNSAANVGAALGLTLRYGAGNSIQKTVGDLGSLIESVDAIVVAAGANNPAPLLTALRSSGLVRDGVQIIGTNKWQEYPLNDPVFDGVLLAAIDQNEFGTIQGRFRAAYGRDADIYAGYAYDQIALSAGVASAVGPKGFTKQVLENSSGFRASTGIFRFQSDGSIQRPVPLYRLKQGKLELVSKARTQF